MMRYTRAILLSSVFWILLATYQLSRGKPILLLDLIGAWLFYTFVFSLPCNALANSIRSRLHWPPISILFLTPAIFLPLTLLWLTLTTSMMSRHIPLESLIKPSLILYLGTLPLSLSLLVTWRSVPKD